MRTWLDNRARQTLLSATLLCSLGSPAPAGAQAPAANSSRDSGSFVLDSRAGVLPGDDATTAPSTSNPTGAATQASAPSASGAATREESSPAGQIEDCGRLQKRQANWYVVVFDAKTQLFRLTREFTYPSVTIRLCIDHPDYRYRYRAVTSYTDLAAPDSKDLIAFVTSNLNKRGATSLIPEAGIDPADPVGAAINLDIIEGALSTIQETLKGQLDQLTGPSYLDRKQAKRIDAECAKQTNQLTQESEHARRIGEAMAAFQKKTPITTDEVAKAKEAADRARGLYATAARLTTLATGIRKHIAEVDRNVFDVRTIKNKEAEVVVTAEPLKAKVEAETHVFYGDKVELGRQKFQIRSLSYVRYSLGIVYTTLRNQSVVRGYNDVGASVLQVNTELGITPMFFLSHYWCGVDERELQPFTPCQGAHRWANFAPTFALGIPLSTNPLKNLFIGMLWQPVPALAATLGLHVGQINSLRTGFVPGMALPPSTTGFRESDALEEVVRAGLFAGVVITDAVFTQLVRNALQK